MRRIALIIATAGGAGYVPRAPGTVGALVGLVVYALVARQSPALQVGVFVTICGVGTWASAVAARHFGRPDPGQVVIDEVAGQLATLLLLDVGMAGLLIGFLLFRVLDIVKPWPANRLEALHGGLGIMADDVMAGAYGWGILWAILTWVPWLR